MFVLQERLVFSILGARKNTMPHKAREDLQTVLSYTLKAQGMEVVNSQAEHRILTLSKGYSS